jgi:5-methylcytosine-specific restriction endonuclease McrA
MRLFTFEHASIMCRGNDRCTLLGPNDSWSQYAPLVPPIWFWNEVRAFAAAARLAAGGDVGAAREQFCALRNDAAREWFVEHGQISGTTRMRRLGRRHVSPRAASVRQGTPMSVRRPVWERDKYHCRYCALPTIHQSVREALQDVVGRDVITWGDTNAARHGIALIARTEYDHVQPLSRGGSNDESNLVTACPGCNYGKDRFTLEELGLEDPRSRPPVLKEWDGLVSLVPQLKAVARMKARGIF